MAQEILEMIYRKYYEKVLKYCLVRLYGNLSAAEDCTQEVFLIFQKHISKLILTDEIFPWLCRTADNVMKAYRRKNPEMLDIDEIPEPAAPMAEESILDILTEEERHLTELYYQGADKKLLAKQAGLTMEALYQKMRRIKKKLAEKNGITDKK